MHIKCENMEAASAFRSGRVLDVTVIDCISFDPVDILTAGPPCPPWSSLGCGKITEGPRAEVFNAVVECVIHWGKMGLKVFLLENVLGVLKSWKGGRVFMSELVCFFQKKMP